MGKISKIFNMLGVEILQENINVYSEPILIDGLKGSIGKEAESKKGIAQIEDGTERVLFQTTNQEKIIFDEAVGVNTHIRWDNEEGQTLQKEYLKSGNIKMIRDMPEWNGIELDTTSYYKAGTSFLNFDGATMTANSGVFVEAEYVTAQYFDYKNTSRYSDDTGKFELELTTIDIVNAVSVDIEYQSTTGTTIKTVSIGVGSGYNRHFITLEDVEFNSADSFHIRITPAIQEDFKLKKVVCRKLRTYTGTDYNYVDYPDYDFVNVDELVDLGIEADIDVIGPVGYSDKNRMYDVSLPPDGSTKHRPNFEAWTKFIKVLVSTYKHKIKKWQIWNEPNIGFWLETDEEFFEFFKDTADVIKSIDDTLKIVFSGTANESVATTQEYIQALVDSGVIDKCDYYSHHIYRENVLEVEYIIDLIDVIAQQGVDTVATEVGWSTHTGNENLKVTIQKQAENTLKNLAMAFSLDIKKVWIYDLRNDGTSATSKEDNFGILYENKTEKKSAKVLQNALLFFEGYEYAGWNKLGDDDNYIYVFKKDSNYKAMVWRKSVGVFSRTDLLNDVVDVDIEANADTFECVLTYDSLSIASSFEIDFDGRTYQTTDKSFTISNLEANTGYVAMFRAYDVYGVVITEKDIAFTTLNKMITTVKSVKQYMKSTDFLYYEEITRLIEEVEETILQYRNKDFDVVDDVLVYPVGSELVAIELVASKLLKEKTDKTAEKLGDYSIGYKGDTVSNENEILKGIKRFGMFS